jgi:hypothetical protein
MTKPLRFPTKPGIGCENFYITRVVPTESKSRPTHRVYVVTKSGEKKFAGTTLKAVIAIALNHAAIRSC